MLHFSTGLEMKQDVWLRWTVVSCTLLGAAYVYNVNVCHGRSDMNFRGKRALPEHRSTSLPIYALLFETSSWPNYLYIYISIV